MAGHFAPDQQFWGNDVDGLRSDTPSIFEDPVAGKWQWAFFGDNTVPLTLFVAQETADSLDDFFCYMGNNPENGNASADGMNVFGFGRSLKTAPLMQGPNRFIIGFFPRKANSNKTLGQLEQHIRQMIQQTL